MKTKIFGLALMLSLATMLGACDGGSQPAGTTSSPAATTGGEPADTGATPRRPHLLMRQHLPQLLHPLLRPHLLRLLPKNLSIG